MEKSGNRLNKPRNTGRSGGKKSFDKDRSSGSDRKRFDKRDKGSDGDRSHFSKRSDKPYKKKEYGNDRGEKRSYSDKDKGYGEKRSFSDKKPFRKKFDDPERGEKKYFKKDDKGYGEKRHFGDKKPFRKKFNEDGDKPFRKKYSEDRGEKKYSGKEDKGYGEKRSFRDKEKHGFNRDKKSFHKKHGDRDREEHSYRKKYRNDDSKEHSYEKKYADKKFKKHHDKHEKHHDEPKHDGLMRLNKYLSNAGICSRREADDLIKAGAVSVNGKVVTEMGFKVSPTDKINYGGETLRHQKKIYLLLNKPKDYITTTDDPHERRTVMELIHGACKERIYPVGRLDRNTTGLLLFTNDGELATKLMHPKYGIKKVYQVTLNKNLKSEDFQDIMNGIELEDGPIKPDEMSYLEGSKKELGIEIHSGRNRIVRRIFEHMGYEVVKLDRVVFAGLTKKDLPRAKWRFLSEKEVGFLKMIG